MIAHNPNPESEPLDRVFANKTQVTDFRFGEEVAKVFDDMLYRSVPFYGEVQRMISELALDFAVEGSNVYDLGCSTGTTMLNLDAVLPKNIKFYGLDNSPEMLERCRGKLEAGGLTRPHELLCADLNEGVLMENASIALMVLTLQFIRPLYRDKLVAQILRGLNPNGCLILVEKVIGEDSLFNRLFIKHYYEMKRQNGYSDLEISQKREALENVLVPYKLLENRAMLIQAGFRYCDVFFKWYNFCGMVAVK